MMRVAICITTFQRSVVLRRLLDSIVGLQIQSTAADVCVVIVDNDIHASARQVVTDAIPDFKFKISYDVEPVRGLASARNRAVKMAAGADFLAFVDDDETVDPEWLEHLLAEQRISAADVVMGPVAPQFTQPPPSWVIKSRFFEKNCHMNEKVNENYASGGNMLIRGRCFENLPEPFDRSFNLKVGSDYYLLARLRMMGAKISWAPKANVVEYIIPERANAKWILRRRFKIGMAIAISERLLKPRCWLLLRPLKGLARIAQGCASLPFAFLQGKAGLVRRLGWIFFGLGNLSGLCSGRYRENGAGENDRT